MSRRAYSYKWCHVCGKNISASGGGVHHYRMHVRKGEMVETVHYPNDYKRRYSQFTVASGVQMIFEPPWRDRH